MVTTVSAGFIHETTVLLIQFLFFLLMMAAAEAGFRIGRNADARTAEKTKAQISVLEGSVLGVLGLLLGFTMSMAVSRFEVRKQLVLDEANAIGTSYLRAQLIPAPEGPEIASLLRDYVDMRMQFAGAGDDVERLKTTQAQTERLQTSFWIRAVAYAQKDPNPVKAGLVLQSLNQVIDLEAARWMAFLNHVPESVIYVNAIVALLAATLVGYAIGLAGRRNIFSVCILSIAIAVVLAVIIDLDRPHQGFIHVSQQPMIDLQHKLQQSKP